MRFAATLAACLAAAVAVSCSTLKNAAAPSPAAVQAAAAASQAASASLEKEALAHLERIRAIKPGADAKLADQYNRQLGEAWKFFAANGKVAVPILRQQLALELKKPTRNDFFLLDVGYYLYQRGEAADKELAKTALYILDPRAQIIRFNQQELFQFTHSVAADRDPRVLALLDSAFLRDKLTVRLPEHNLTLDETLVCVFLYGAYGSGAEAHLKSQLGDKRLARKIVEILLWIGSPASNADIKTAMAAAGRDYEMFVRAATFLMTMGGPPGRAIVLGVKPENLDVWTQAYYGKIRKPVQGTTFAELRKPFADAPDEAAILDSKRPREVLIAELIRGRDEKLKQASGDTLAEVKKTNALINALRYREK